MKESDGRSDNENVTSKIVRIAYRQSRELSGTDDPSDSAEKNKRNKNGYACVQRLSSLPIVASINSSVTGAYSRAKESHPAVETILNKTEQGITEGARIVSPLASKIGETLEEPLKSIDSAVCDGLDYLEDKLPSVKLPPAKIYENLEGYIRNLSDNVKQHSTEICADVKHRLEEFGKVVQGEAGQKSNDTEDGEKHGTNDR